MNNKFKHDVKQAWDYIYGSKSHMNLAGKLIIGVPFFPFMFTLVMAFIALDILFSKLVK